MSSNCDITNLVTNQTGYTFTLNTSSLDSGNWVVSPQPIPASPATFNAFQAIGVSGTATGAVGQSTYNVIQNGASIGSITFNFSDPYSGHNYCTSSSTVPGLEASNDCPSSGSTFSVNWTITAG